MKFRRMFLAVLFTVFAGTIAVGILSIYTPVSAVKNVPGVDPLFNGKLAMQHLNMLAHRFRGRVTGSAQGYAAADYMAMQLRSYGLQVDTQDFSEAGGYSKSEMGWYRGRNVIGMLSGQEHGTVVLTAHRDCFPSAPEGAYDNGSGSVAVLELARALAASRPHRYSYAFVALDGEEVGLAGSRFLMNNRPPGLDDIRLMINLDMIGYNGKNLKGIDYTWYLPPETRALAQNHFQLPHYSLFQIPVGRGSDAILYCWRGLPTLDLFELPMSAKGEIHNSKDGTNQVSADAIQQTGRTLERFIIQGDVAGCFPRPEGAVIFNGSGILMPWRYTLGGICILVAFAIPMLFRVRFCSCGGRPEWIMSTLILLSGILTILSAYWHGSIYFVLLPVAVSIVFPIVHSISLRREKSANPELGRFLVSATPAALFAGIWILTGLWPLGFSLALVAYFPAVFLNWKSGLGWRFLDVFLLLPVTLLSWLVSLIALMLAPTHLFPSMKLASFNAILTGIALIETWGIFGRRPARRSTGGRC